MSKKRINLFGKANGKSINAIVAEKTVRYATFVGICFFAVFLILSIMNIIQKSKIQALQEEQVKYLTFIKENKNSETDTAYFLLKKEQLKKFMKDDAQFLPYYTIIQDSLNTSSNAATIQKMLIDKTKKTEFNISFNDYDAMNVFIKYIESDKFLKNFESLTLENFSLNKSGKGYEIDFTGKFKELNDKAS